MTARNIGGVTGSVPGGTGRLVQWKKSRLADVVACIAVAALWFLLWKVARVANAGPYTSLWYPPAALTFSLLIAGGWRALPLAFAGPLLVTSIQNNAGVYAFQTTSQFENLLEYVVPPVAHLIGYAFAAYGIQRSNKLDPNARGTVYLSPGFAIGFVAFALAGSAVSAAAGAASSIHQTGGAWGTWLTLFLHWWSGDFIGVVTLTPVLLLAFSMLSYAPLHVHVHPFERHAADKHSQFGIRYWLSLASTFGSVAFLLWLKVAYQLPIPYSLSFLIGLIGMGLIALGNELAAVSVMIALMGLLSAVGIAFIGNFELVTELNFFIPACTLASMLSHTMRHLVAQTRLLASETLHDPLTGVCNRKGLAFHFSAHLRDIQGGRRRLCLASMDLDHFKRVNDTLGHAVGDDVLKRVTRLLSDHASASDCIARIGGDEIVILLPGFSLDQCVKKVETMRREIAAIIDLPISVTASIGIIQVEPHNTQEIALARADSLLYRAKALGRNRVEQDTVPV